MAYRLVRPRYHVLMDKISSELLIDKSVNRYQVISNRRDSHSSFPHPPSPRNDWFFFSRKMLLKKLGILARRQKP